MQNTSTKCSVDSAGLRRRLEDHLTAIFTTKTIGRYLDIDGSGPEIQILQHCGEQAMTFPCIKLAYRIWLSMEAIDRHSVLCKFHHFYAELAEVSTGNRKTLVFCALFVHEFAKLLAEATGWPD